MVAIRFSVTLLALLLTASNAGAQSFEDGQSFGDGSSVNFATADIDGDGDADLAVTEFQPMTEIPTLVFWRNQGVFSGTFAKTGQTIDEVNASSFGFADFDGDGDPDLLAGHFGTGFAIWMNEGLFSGEFTKTGASIDSDLIVMPAFGDVDGDGDIDILLQISTAIELWINQDLHSATFARFDQEIGAVPTLLGGIRSVRFVDIDNDGDLDFYAGAHAFGSDALWLNDLNGTGVFINSGHTTSVHPENFSGTGNLQFADVDGDGDMDLIAQNWEAGLWLNDGDATGDLVPSDDAPKRFANFETFDLGDFDGDGDTDVYYPGSAGSEVWTNQGVNSGVFVASEAIHPAAQIVEAHDVDNDGDLDLIAVRDYTNMVVILNTTATVVDAEYVRNHFAELDENDDLRLTRAESTLARIDFDAVDANGDGYLTMAELLESSVGPVGVQSMVYADFAFSGTELGTIAAPFNTLFEAVTFVAAAGVVRVETGNSPEIIRLNAPLRIEAQHGPVRVGATSTP